MMYVMKKIETFTLPETRFLSNFYPYKNKEGEKYPETVRVMFEGVAFDCTEKAYQAAKSLDHNVRKAISKMSPYEAKAYWEGKDDQVRPDWLEVRDALMLDFNLQKFHGNLNLWKMLKATGDAELIEGNTWGDTYWGVCDGVGQNKLGNMLRKIRDEIPFADE